MYNAQEQKLRRRLKKIGYSLVKCRGVDNYPGGYMLIDENWHIVAAGENPMARLSLSEVEEWLAEDE